ncbi:MAG: hypothetical protein Udaeo2_20720 [Candidatus Udaeobacter sp.]|nr:MAG: hypothetical protein Udaeo2_20720 [Candidatus Udaeobacter sp.]
MSALKRTNLIASVNNDIISADPHPCDYNLRCMGHCSHVTPFPFYPGDTHGRIENFISTLLLGNPR